MTDALLALWKKNYPSWPDDLINRFSTYIEIQANLYDATIGASYAQAYSQIQLPIFDIALNMGLGNLSATIFSPSNSNYVSTLTLNGSNGRQVLPPSSISDTYNILTSQIISAQVNLDAWNNSPYSQKILNGGIPGQINIFGSINYDNRLLNAALNINSIYGVLSQSYGTGTQWTVQSRAKISIGSLINYSQINSIIAMLENGFTISNIDLQSAKDFFSYYTAYQKYRDQIESAGALSLAQAQADLQQYQQSLADKLTAEKNSLQNLQLQINTAMQNQLTTTKQNLTNTVLQAASLKIEIIQGLG